MSGIGELAIDQPLLIIAILAVLAASTGWMIERDRPALARGLRQSGYLGMLAAALLLTGQLAHNASRSDAALMLNSRPRLVVNGPETVVPMASDGHFWVDAEVNGKSFEFLIDTGATFTGMGREDARAAGLERDPGELPLELDTANGTIAASLSTAREFRFGSVVVQRLQIAVPDKVNDKTNVIGMDLLSQLGSWRVEGDRLILVPKG